jgi:tetratricopeptide (TPR) repeat protein
MAPIIFDALCNVGAAQAAYERDDLVAARSIAHNAVTRVQASKPARGVQEVQKYVTLFLASNIAGHAEYLLGDYAAAERAQREAIEARKKYLTEAISDRRDVAEKSTWLAMALARQNRLGEAAEVIAPVLKFHRELAAKNKGDRWQTLEFASALYAEALTDPKKSAALLREAAALVDGLPATLHAVRDVRKWRERIHQAQQGAG